MPPGSHPWKNRICGHGRGGSLGKNRRSLRCPGEGHESSVWLLQSMSLWGTSVGSSPYHRNRFGLLRNFGCICKEGVSYPAPFTR